MRERCIVGCMDELFVSFMNTVVLTVLLVRSVVRRLYWRRRVKVD